MVTAERTWAALGIAITAYEVLCPAGQLLSEGVDRWLVSHPVKTRVVTAYLALHLLNLVPNRIDPLHLLALHTRKAARSLSKPSKGQGLGIHPRNA